jgi:hypothetical protein
MIIMEGNIFYEERNIWHFSVCATVCHVRLPGSDGSVRGAFLVGPAAGFPAVKLLETNPYFSEAYTNKTGHSY